MNISPSLFCSNVLFARMVRLWPNEFTRKKSVLSTFDQISHDYNFFSFYFDKLDNSKAFYIIRHIKKMHFWFYRKFWKSIWKFSKFLPPNIHSLHTLSDTNKKKICLTCLFFCVSHDESLCRFCFSRYSIGLTCTSNFILILSGRKICRILFIQ